MKPRRNLMFVGLVFLALGTALVGCDEEEIPLSEVPEKALEAAKKAVPGIRLTEAEFEKTSEGEVYEVEGTLDGVEYEITISADGKVLEVEREDEGEDDDDEDGEDDKDDAED